MSFYYKKELIIYRTYLCHWNHPEHKGYEFDLDINI